MKLTSVLDRRALAVILVLGAGCRKQEPTESSPASAQTEPEKAREAETSDGRPLADKAQEPSEAAPLADAGALASDATANADAVTDAGSADKASAKRRTPAEKERDEVVTMLLEPGLVSMTPNEALAHYSGLSFERAEPVPDSVDLVARVGKGAVKIGYVKEHGAWVFTNARYELPGTDEAEVEQSFREMSEVVRARLGQPKEVVAKRPFLGERYPLSDKLEAYVGAITGEVPVPHAIISITLPGA